MARSQHPAAPLSLPLTWLVATAWACALVAALVFASQIQLSMLTHGHQWHRIFLWQAVSWGYWAAVSPWILRRGAALIASKEPLRRLVHLCAFGLGAIALHQLVGAGALWAIRPYEPVETYGLVTSLVRTVMAWAGIDPLLFGILAACGYGVGGFATARERELQQSRLETELARAQLDALRLEIQPHFLFNTLNSIAALLRSDDHDKALTMLVELGALLRATTEHSGGALVPLREELAFVRRYLDLQGMRFGDRLAVHYSIPDTCLDATVPFLLLQPLAENAIQYAVASRSRGGTIHISAKTEGDILVLEVADDGPGLPADFDFDTSAGIGLRNTRARLQRIYREGGPVHSRASLTIRSRDQGGTLVTARLPQPSRPGGNP